MFWRFQSPLTSPLSPGRGEFCKLKGRKKMTIYVDAGCSGNPGPTYYRGLNRNGILLFDREFSFGTNNIGEFLAICTGVAYLIERNGGNGSVWSDSKVAITWFNNGRIKTTIERNEKSREVLLLEICVWRNYVCGLRLFF